MTARPSQIITQRPGVDRTAEPTSDLYGTVEAQHVALVDASGNQVTSFGGGTQYTEDAAAAADPVGGVTMLVRKDTPAATVTTDGDNIAQRGTNYGAGYVTILTSAGALVDSFGSSIEKWSALATEQVMFSDAGGSIVSAKALANGSLVLSAAYDNSTARHQRGHLKLDVRGASAFTAGTTVDLWIIHSQDGSVFGDGSASVTPARPPDAYFFLRAVNTAQVIHLPDLDIPPTSFKILIRNSGGQAFTNTDNENKLNIRTYTTAFA